MGPKSVLLFSSALLLAGCIFAQAQPARPAITGISHMAVYTSDPTAADHFYREELGGVRQPDLEDRRGVVYQLSWTQFVEVLPLPPGQQITRLDHVAFETPDVSALREYLVAHQYEVGPINTDTNGNKWFSTYDPERNRVQFYQSSGSCVSNGNSPCFGAALDEKRLVSPRIIHVGFLVRDRAKEDGFYRELLGFRPYWYGAMHPEKLDWVSQQVPDGHDWLEYMMTGPGSDTPDADKVDGRQLGVLNHFSLGVPDMERAVTALYASDLLRYSPRHDGPQMGKDGKWQANLYDPDGTRVELMEFQPVMKPCCSEFTAESPAN